jgi:hypothetical protein
MSAPRAPGRRHWTFGAAHDTIARCGHAGERSRAWRRVHDRPQDVDGKESGMEIRGAR